MQERNNICWGCSTDWLESDEQKEAGLTPISYNGEDINVCIACYEELQEQLNNSDA